MSSFASRTVRDDACAAGRGRGTRMGLRAEGRLPRLAGERAGTTTTTHPSQDRHGGRISVGRAQDADRADAAGAGGTGCACDPGAQGHHRRGHRRALALAGALELRDTPVTGTSAATAESMAPATRGQAANFAGVRLLLVLDLGLPAHRRAGLGHQGQRD